MTALPYALLFCTALHFTVSKLGRDERYLGKYSPWPEGNSKGEGLFLTFYSESGPNTDSVSFKSIILIMIL